MQQDVLFGMTLTLLERKKVSAKEFSHLFGISVRTAYRYIDVLCAAGVPVVSTAGQHGGFWLSENYVLRSAYLTTDEFQRILSGLQTVPGVPGDVQNQVLMSKIKALSKADFMLQSNRLLVNSSGFNALRNKMSVLQKALYAQTVLEIRYHSRSGEVTERAIEPHAFLLEGGIWYVYAFCRLRGVFRLFKVSRIAAIISTEEKFERRQAAEPPQNDGERDGKTKMLDIELLVEEKCRLDVEEWIGVENVSGDRANFRMPFDSETVSKILSFGDGVRAVEPQELKDAVKSALLSMAKLYV